MADDQSKYDIISDNVKKIRIKFIDYYNTPPEHILFYRVLRRLYDVEICENPDYVFDGGLGHEHVNYSCVKICYIGESYSPDFNSFDYVLGFDHLDFGDRYLRFPFYAVRGEFQSLDPAGFRLARSELLPEKLLARDFCSFVVSNGDGDPTRFEFFRKLSKYKPVASGGRMFNNVGGRVPDKVAFVARHKFNVAFENSCMPGYTTEKLMEPLVAHSVPVYYGNPQVEKDFDPACMVRVRSRDDMDRAIEEIVALDRDDAAYLKKIEAPTCVHPYAWHEERLVAFLRNIFDPPAEEARRLNAFGYQTDVRRRIRRLWNMYEWTSPARIVKRIRKAL